MIMGFLRSHYVGALILASVRVQCFVGALNTGRGVPTHPGARGAAHLGGISLARQRPTRAHRPVRASTLHWARASPDEEGTTSATERSGRTRGKKKGEGPTSADAKGADADQDEDGIPPDVLRSFSLLLLSQFVLFVGVGAVIPVLPLYGQSIGLSGQSNGLVISAPAVALLLVSRASGECSDKGRKGAMLGGMALIAVSDVGTALSHGLAPLIAARLGLGLGRGYAEAGERGMLADLANRAAALRGRALALQQASVALGIALGAPLGGLVVERYGPRSAFFCVSAAALFALGIYCFLPETLTAKEVEAQESGKETRPPPKNAEAATTNNNEEANEEADWVRLLQTSSTWRSLAVAQSGISFGFACKIAIVPILANAYLGGATGAGLLLSAAGLAGLAGAPLGGVLADRAGARAAAAVTGAASGVSLALVPVGLAFTGLETTAPALPLDAVEASGTVWTSLLAGVGGPQAAAFTLLVLLWSAGASAQGPALTALAQENAPRGSEATALGLPRAVGDGTYIVAPLLLGYVSDALGESVPGLACTVAGGAICAGSLALFLVPAGEDGTRDAR